MRCGNCAEEIRPVAPGDGIDENDREAYPWVNEAGNPYCDASLTHEPMAAFSWRDMFARYAAAVERHEGITYLEESEWTPEEWAAICALLPDPEVSGRREQAP